VSAPDPQTPTEWQEAVNLAAAWLRFDAARRYGLITGGQTVDVVRCRELLSRGLANGWVPREVDVDAAIDRIVRGG